MTFNLACPQGENRGFVTENKALYLALIVSVCGVEWSQPNIRIHSPPTRIFSMAFSAVTFVVLITH